MAGRGLMRGIGTFIYKSAVVDYLEGRLKQMEQKEYRITFKSHLANCWQILGYALVSIMGLCILPWMRPDADPELAMETGIWVFGVAFLLQLLPQLAIHMNY